MPSVTRDPSFTGMGRYEPAAIETTVPDVELVDPTPFSARSAARALIGSGRSIELPTEDQDGLIGAVSEVVTNALVHGVPPVRLRGWADQARIVITVHDRGPGPTDGAVGTRPDHRGPGLGGFGLWLAHELCAVVAMGADDDGFTVRLATADGPDRGREATSAGRVLQPQQGRQAAQLEHAPDRR